jgi:hypothetical protein
VLAGGFAIALLAALPPVPLSGTFPAETPSGSVIAGWTRFAGELESEGSRIAYELYVEPRRLGLFVLTRFRVRPPHASIGDEILIWNARPGLEPLRCFARVSRPNPWALGLLPMWHWEGVPVGTNPYRQAMFTAIKVYYLHEAARQAADPDLAR